MRTIKAILLPVVILGFCLCLWGCAWGHWTEGSVFDASDINQIVKGKTTTADLMNIFGTPYSKTPGADGGEQWYYYCSHNYDSVGGVPALIVENKSIQKNDLVVMVNKDKVVVDYKLNEGPTVKKTDATLIVASPLDIPIPVYSSSQTSTNSKTEGVTPKP
jgi:hypothetical protein